MLDRNKILSDQKLQIDIQPPVSEMPLLKASSPSSNVPNKRADKFLAEFQFSSALLIPFHTIWDPLDNVMQIH